MRKTLRIAGFVGIVALAAAVVQALNVRPDITNQATDFGKSIQSQPGTPIALAEVLTRSCGECHSNTMTSRWYMRVPPFSALMARGAVEGRKAVNFAAWTGYSPEQQRALLLASCTDVKRGTMPIKAYLRFRADARLSTRDIETICSAVPPVTPNDGTPARKGP